MVAFFHRWVRRALEASPPWAPQAGAAVAIALPLLVAGGYTAAQQFGGGPADPIDPVNRTSVYEDSDRDGLPNLLENYVYGTDPNETRTTSSVVPDGYLARHGYDPADPAAEDQWAAYPPAEETPDAWGSGPLPPSHRVTVRELYTWNRPADYDENESGPWENGLDPEVWRSPSGLPVSWLLTHDLDPLEANVSDRVLDPEPDGDGLTVEESYRSATDPRVADTDGDGLDDDREVNELSTDPSAFSTAGGGVADGWAVQYGLNATDPRMPFRDPDADGLSNAREFNASVELYGLGATLNGSGLDPTQQATAGAPIPDGWLVEQGLDPRAAGVAQTELSCASDHEVPREVDGLDDVCLTVLDAYRYRRPPTWDESDRGPWMGGLSARTNDTDGDGIPDPVELRGWFVNVSSGLGSEDAAESTHVTPDPLSADTDGDGLGDRAEFLGRATVGGATVTFNVTDPENRDTDFDGLSDGREILEITRQLARHGDEGENLDPTRRDTDGDALEDGREWFLLRDRAERCREGSADYGFTNPVAATKKVLRSIARETGAELPEGVDSVCGLLEPWGDPDADGAPNVLDRDSDGDSLWDGWEAVPSTYDQSPWASVHPRSRTDPVNPDSDGDGLPDGWEVKHGEWNRTLQGFNLDPARWSSFGDDLSDAERDLDHDSITWSTFHRSVQGFEREEHAFRATNLVEYRNGTDPNLASTPETDLLDGWTIFWGRVYPDLAAEDVGDVYPGAPGPFFVPPSAPRPNPVTGENPTIRTESVNRFSTERNPGPDETLIQAFEDVETADGETITAYLFERSVQETFRFEQEQGTNPYLEDTDGDGAPDAWEFGIGDDTHPDPLVHEGGSDEDDDGLSLEREYQRRTNPAKADTDLGGVDDGEEVDAGRSPLDPSDDISVSDPDADLDCDGIEDVRESEGWEPHDIGEITTNPLVPDSDRDGLLDGSTRVLSPDQDQACIETLKSHGVLSRPSGEEIEFLGEVTWRGDPRTSSTAGDGVPDGYRAWWGFQATDEPPHLVEAYEANKPDWWDEATMGPWMWGPAPESGTDVDGDGRTDWTTEGTRFVLKDTDLDEDGLDDLNGEDPTPGARPALAPPNGWPDASATTHKEQRFRAATFGVPLDERSEAAGRDRDDDGVEDPHDKLPALVRDLDLVDVEPSDGRFELSQTSSYRLTGRVLADPGDQEPVAVPNATVVAEFVDHDHPVGAGFTDADGRFSINVTFSGERETTVPEGLVLFGRTGRPMTWTVDVTDLPRGAGSETTSNVLRVWVTNTSGASLPGDPTHLGVRGTMTTDGGGTTEEVASGLSGAVSEDLPVSLVTATELTLEVPPAAAPGREVPATVTLTDAGGQGLANETVTLSTPNRTRSLTTNDQGIARANLTLPTSLGRVPVDASFDGGAFTRAVATEANVTVKDSTSVHLTSIEPTPVIAGRNVTVSGRLVADDSAANRTINVSAPAGSVRAGTRPDGGFAARFPWPSDAVGSQQVAAAFDGSGTLLADEAEADVQVLGGAEVTLTTPGESLGPDSPFVVRARLTDATGTPLPDETLRLSGLPDRSSVPLETDATGGVTLEATAPERPGAWQLTAAFAGTSSHAPDRAFGWVNVSVPTLLNLDAPDRVTRGSIATLTGTLRTSDGTAVAGQPVLVTGGEDAIGTAVTGPRGGFDVDWTVGQDTTLGRLEFSASFNGSADARYQPSSGIAQTTVREGLEITPRTIELQRGVNPIDLDVRLESGQSAPDGTLALRSPSLEIDTETDVSDGTARFRIPVRERANLGSHDVRLRYDPDASIPETTIDTTATVVAPVKITGVSRAVATPGDAIHLSGRVEVLDGGETPTGILHADLPGTVQNVTVAQGEFDLNVTLPGNVSSGDHTVDLVWPRQNPYLGTEREVPLTVRESVEIDVEFEEPSGSGEPVRGRLSVRTANGDPVARESVLIESGDGLAFLVETNDEGNARVVLPPPGQNGTSYDVHFAGRGSLATASTQATVAPVPGTGANPWVLAGIASTVLLALVGGVTWYLYRRRRELAATVAEELEEGGRRLAAGSEYEAAIMHVYETFVDLVAEREVQIEDPDTLREFQNRVERVLGVEGRAIDDLFTVFDDVFYGPGTPQRRHRDRATTAFYRTARLLREQTREDEVSQ